MTVPAGGEGLPRRIEGRDPAVLHDRRRPGRRNVASSLIPLLRNQAPDMVDADRVADQPGRAVARPARDELSTSVGLARGLGIAGLVWVVVAVLIAY